MPAAPTGRAVGTGYTVLVVDDDPRIVELLNIALGAHGYRVISASNGEDALRSAFEEQPDLVILDVRLPRRSGYEVCEAIRREPELAHLPVIMVSALAETEARLAGLARGADDYLPKPFSPKELLAKVRRALVRVEELKTLQRRTRELVGEVERSREETRRAQDDLRRERVVQDAYTRLSQELARLNRPEEVSSTFLFALMTQLGVESAAMLLPDPGAEGALAPQLARGLTPEREALLRVAADGELARLFVALGRPVRREEMERFPILRSELDPLVAAGAALFVPLSAHGRLVGVAVLGEKADGSSFPNGDLEMAASLSQAAALAVEQSALVRHAEETYLHAVRTYASAVESRHPGTLERAEAIAAVAGALSRELGFEESSALSLRLAALAEALHQVMGEELEELAKPPVWGSLSDAPGLESDILEVARGLVDLSGRVEAGATPREVVARLTGDRHVLSALEDLLARGEVAVPTLRPGPVAAAGVAGEE
jgi:DNA-binding response OmpR family regulator